MKKGRVSSVVGLLGIIFLIVGSCALAFSLVIDAGIAGLIPSGAFILIGFILIVIVKGMERKKQKLIEKGVKAEAVITNVVRDLTVRVNNGHPYRAECRVTDHFTGAVYLYSSPRIIQDITHLIGHNVTVYYDPDNRKKYFVDIESAIAETSENGPEIYDYR